MGCTQWDVDVEFTIECILDMDDKHIYIVDDDRDLPSYLFLEIFNGLPRELWLLNDGTFCAEVIIPFRSKGYYDPGKLYGPPERCYPPEGDDERTLFGNCQVLIYDDLSNKRITTITLSEKMSNELFDMFEEEIIKKDIGDVINDSLEDWRY